MTDGIEAGVPNQRPESDRSTLIHHLRARGRNPATASAGRRPPSGLAVTVAVLMVLSSLGLVSGLAFPTAAPGGTAAPAVHTSSSAGALPAAASQALGANGTCASGSSVASPAVASAAARYVTPSGVYSPPLFNSQVEPYAVLAGPYAYVAGGAALRDLGYGYINLTWPGGSTANLVAAYMVWSIMDDSVPSANATLNGVNLTGTWTAYATPSPCWAPTYIYTFVADVTDLIVNGNNTLTNFPSGITNGGDPWLEPQVDPMDEGATLVAVYENNTLPIHEVTVYTGALTTEGGSLLAFLNYTTTDSSAAETTYMVADGQLPDNEAVWNGSVIDPNAFAGTAPKDTATDWSYGNLYDTKTYGVPVVDGSDSTSASVVTDGSDCVTWIGQVVDVQIAPTPPPYTAVFQEQGLPDGTSWSVTTNDETNIGTVENGTSSFSFALTNSTYRFVVGPEPGYTTPSRTGVFTIDGGGVYIRILFHPVLYAITFQETGSPVSEYWYVELNNTSQALTDFQSTAAPAPIVFDEPNGTYNFTAGSEASLYTTVPSAGVVVVAGDNLTVSIDIVAPELFNVTFLEVGLPAGTAWGAYTYTNWGDFSNSTTEPSFSLQLPNATYDEVVPVQVPGYFAPDYQDFGVYAGPETVQINYSAVYPVYLNETGLPGGTYFEAYLSSPSLSYYGSSDNGSIWFFLPNGTYTFTIESVWGYQATPSSGTLTVNGGPVRQPIVFSPETKYDLTFNETGLPAGTSWSVELYLPNGSVLTEGSTTASITFQEPNGSFTFVVGTVPGFQASPTYGYPEIAGANTFVAIDFEKAFSVTFVEVGLDLNGYTYWYVYFGEEYNYSYGPSITFTAPNGTYDFEAVAPYWDHTPDYIDGTLEVDGASVTQTVSFGVPQNFTVTFTESGLPSGTTWFVNVTGGASYSSTTDEIIAELPNGSYDYGVGSMNTSWLAPGGSFTVSGAAVPVAVTFALVTFTVTFKETGLPAGSTWYLNLSNGRSFRTSASSLAFSEPNGSYPYTFGGTRVINLKEYYSAAPGTFLVSGHAVTVSVTFTQARQVVLTEKNLPVGMEWWANLTGGGSFHSVGPTIIFFLPAGTWTFNVQALNHDYTAPGHTVIVTTPVKKSPVKYTEKFKLEKFKVTVTESGLPKGSSWCLVIDGGTPVCTKKTSLSVMEPNGTYTYTLTTTALHYSAPSGGFAVTGTARTIAVKFTT